MTELEELRLSYAECSRQRNELLAKLRTEARQRQPLTEYEAWEIWDALADRGKKGEDIVHAFARAVERAHGIGGQDDTR